MTWASVTPVLKRYFEASVRRNNDDLLMLAERQGSVVVSWSIDCRTLTQAVELVERLLTGCTTLARANVSPVRGTGQA